MVQNDENTAKRGKSFTKQKETEESSPPVRQKGGPKKKGKQKKSGRKSNEKGYKKGGQKC